MLPLALSLAGEFLPSIVKYFTNSDTAGGVAGKVVDIAKAVTGQSEPDQISAALKANPAMALQFKTAVMANETELSRMAYADKQAEHAEQQETIRGGDNANDEYVRTTRPRIVRQSWYAFVFYVFITEILNRLDASVDGANWEIAITLLTPTLAYFGFRTGDKFAQMLKK